MKRGIFLLVLATILWGGNYICGRFLSQELPPTLLNTIRWGLSTVLLWGLLAINKKSFPLLSKAKEFFILGFFGVFAFSTLNYVGLRYLHASVAGMISAGIPIFILLLSPLFLKEKISVKAWIGTVISIAGVILLIQGKQADASEGSLLGEIAILLSCLAWGLYTVLGKRYAKDTDPLTLTAGAAFYGTILSGISCIGTVDASMIHLSTTGLLCILYVSTCASVGAYLAWNAGVKIVGAGKAAPYINLLPVWTVVFGVPLFDEQLSFVTSIGGVITITGAVLASYKGEEKKKMEQLHSAGGR
ncbi:DMT family transporter [Brevibacillus ruminantium]|uniref:DMT family transporter n=1 Tax=Brevibacillus ruminantium TaxID=2950604 RepID=A0ABY4WHQ0_9BACL|nr:DMT family transporter [Brevibacillus ruminantium]USG65663.1 DMT family transporter [Brevibacillus ruminantium]